MAKVAVRRSTSETRLVYDAFTGAGALTAHTPDVAPVGSAWAILAGTFGDLSGGRLPLVSGHSVALINAGAANCEVEALCMAPTSSIALRGNADGSNRYVMMAETAQNRIALWKYTALNTFASLGNSPTGSVPMTNGTDYRFTAYLNGSLMRLLVDGVYVYDEYSTDYAANTYHGVGGWGVSWDDFTVRPAATWQKFLTFGDSISLHDDTHLAIKSVGGMSGAMWDAQLSGLYNNARTWATSVAVGGAHVYGSPDYGKNFADQVEIAIAADYPADLIFCEFGTNDAATLPDITSEYQACLQDIKVAWPGVPIYCLGIFGTTGYNDYDDPAQVAIMDGKIAAAATAEGATFITTYGLIDPATDTLDGIHPNPTGNALIAAGVLAEL